MSEAEDPFYIVRTSSDDEGTAVLKHGDTFVVFDRFGDIYGPRGLFHEDTRYLSGLRLRLGDHAPLMLGSAVQDNNAVVAVDLTNGDLPLEGGGSLPRGSLHLFRAKFLWQGVCFERLRITHFGDDPVLIDLWLELEADFADIFEVRGSRRARRGRRLPPRLVDDRLILAYEGLDGRARQLAVSSSRPADEVRGSGLRFTLSLAPGREETLFLTYACEQGTRSKARCSRSGYDQAHDELQASVDAAYAHECQVVTSNGQFNAWLRRSRADLRMMVSETAHGGYPYAGVPWYSTPFGRDGIITALETVWFDPTMARGVLLFLAATQAASEDPANAAQPGKILHEARKGEMATLGEVPFGRYYGTVDATPLYVVLAAAYHDVTGDTSLISEIWPNLQRALQWIDQSGDVDGDGFVEYRPHKDGLVNQGWKDSVDAIFHADGKLAEGPIALCEVQGYVYAAKRAAAKLASILGFEEQAQELLHAARKLQAHFEQVFWSEELGTYALALDGDKRPCLVKTTNAGHCLFTQIARPDRAKRTAEALLTEDAFTGWGIRTVGARHSRYNPMSYHNGSVWPHDNALVARGMSLYGYKTQALRVMRGLFDATLWFDTHRLPELFCGFPRRQGQGPTLYPVACSPQAWSSGVVFMLLQACLGMTIDAAARRVQFAHPMLPPFLDELRLKRLRVGDAILDLSVHRYPEDVGVNVVRREGSVEVVNIK